ncbi:MAG: hypothetical protein AABY22_13700 [Nanoarchaeota archaeon]
MTLKDWKNLGRNSLGRYAYYNEKKQIRIEIQKEQKGWNVSKDNKYLSPNYKNKKQALRYAKYYMRKN